MRKAHAGALVLCASLLAVVGSGCSSVTTRYVTPWLRTTTSHDFQLFAESGGHNQGWLTVERETHGAWHSMDISDDRAFSFGGGSRAVIGSSIVRANGTTTSLECDGEVRARSASELICVTQPVEQTAPAPVTPAHDIIVLDIDGNERSRERVFVPVAAASGLRPHMQLLGFDGASTVFTVFAEPENVSFAPGTLHTCSAWAWSAEREWTELGGMQTDVLELWRCQSTSEWNALRHWSLRPGAYRQGTSGEPRW